MIIIHSTNTLDSRQGVKCCVYGLAGVGKTRLSRTAPRPIILSAESGLLSLRKENLPYIEIKNYAALTEAYNWSMQSAEARQFDTYLLDSCSEIGEVVLADLRTRHKDPRK